MELHVLNPIYDAGANCKRCSLNTQKKLNQVCFHYAPVPKNWNGIMVVGEGPGRSEVVEGRPFVGASGKLLRALFKSEGLDLDACYITNATLCRPHSHIKGGLMEQAPEAIQHCLPRLEREIQLVKPRVILALGGAALAALTGAEYKVTKRELFVCGYCDEKDRKVSGVQCSKGGCTGLWEGTDEAQKPQVCPVCAATWKRLKVRRVRCPKCSSRKMKDVEHTLFDWDYSITEVAGAVIPAEKHGWDEFGVKYIIPTYHPSFLLRGGESSGSGEKKKMAGQFAAKTVTRHLRKVAHLMKADRPWGFEYEVTSETDDFDAKDHLLEYVYKHDIKDPNFTVDVETEAWGTHYFCTACQKKSGIEQPIDWETAPILPSAACKKCGNDTHQVPQRGELDARVLENVTAINVIGFCDRRRGHALVVDTRNLATMPNLKEALRRVLTDAKLKKTMHHGTYDVPVIQKLWGMWVEGYCGEHGGDDTLMQHHVLCPDESHTLSHLAFRYTFARVWKPPKQLKGHAAHQTFAELCEYNARDVWITDEVRCQMASEIVRKGTAAQVYALDKQLQEQALAMQQNGMPLNMDKARAVGATALKLKRDALTAMREFARNEEFNPNSPEQLRDYLFVKQGYPVILWTDGGKSGNKQPSTAEDALLQLPDTPFKRALLEYREADGTLRAYFDISTGQAIPSRGMRIWGDGRLHATWKPFGARSGRFTTNPNLQNWAKWMREMVEAPDGRMIVGADQAQLELRLTAGLSGDATLLDKCINANEDRKLEPEHDPHSFVASVAFGTVYTSLLLKDPAHDKLNSKCKCETCTRKAYRDLVKRVIYGLNYGAGDAKVLEAIYKGGYNGPSISIEMIGRIRAAIFRAFPGIPVWRNKMVKEAGLKRAVFSPLLGRWRTFPLGDIPVTEIYNFGIQAGGADIMNILGTKFYKLSKKVDPTSRYFAQVHDAVYYEVDAKRADVFCDAMTETLSVKMALVKGGYEMPFVATAHKAQNWMEAA